MGGAFKFTSYVEIVTIGFPFDAQQLAAAAALALGFIIAFTRCARIKIARGRREFGFL